MVCVESKRLKTRPNLERKRIDSHNVTLQQ